MAAEEEEGTWVRVENTADLSTGDRVRVTDRHRPTEQYVGTVRQVDNIGGVQVRHPLSHEGGAWFSPTYRTFEKWVPTAPAFAPPQVGERFNRTYDEGRTPRENCEVTEVTQQHDGRWRVRFSYNGSNIYTTYVLPDGTAQNGVGNLPGRFERIGAPASPGQVGWVPVTDFTTLRAGDIVRAVPNGIGGRMQARVVGPGTVTVYYAATTHVITPSSNGREVDLLCWGDSYRYGAEGHDTVVWRGPGEAPAPASAPLITAEQIAQSVTPDPPLPEWATSLEAARRYVHKEAVELYREDHNCWGGTYDFLSEAGLPTEEEWPEPPKVDESAQIREFLANVRDAALSTADSHGKNITQVEGWLTYHGIVKPPPALTEHTVTFQAPADANVRQVLIDLGWVVRD